MIFFRRLTLLSWACLAKPYSRSFSAANCSAWMSVSGGCVSQSPAEAVFGKRLSHSGTWIRTCRPGHQRGPDLRGGWTGMWPASRTTRARAQEPHSPGTSWSSSVSFCCSCRPAPRSHTVTTPVRAGATNGSEEKVARTMTGFRRSFPVAQLTISASRPSARKAMPSVSSASSVNGSAGWRSQRVDLPKFTWEPK